MRRQVTASHIYGGLILITGLLMNSCAHNVNRDQCNKTRDFFSKEYGVTVTVPWCSDVEINDSSYSVDAINFWKGFETERSMVLTIDDISSYVKFSPSRGNIDTVLQMEKNRAILDNNMIEFVSTHVLKTEEANTLLLTMLTPTNFYHELCIVQFPKENIEVTINYAEIFPQPASERHFQSTFHPDNFSSLKIRKHPKQ